MPPAAALRIGRFELASGDRAAARHLVRSVFVPRSRREALATRALALAGRVSIPVPARLLAQPAPTTGDAPALGESLEAVAGALRRAGMPADVRCGLSLLPTAHAPGRRLLFLWRGDEPLPHAVAKVAAEPARAALAAEGDALERLRGLGREACGPCPAVLAREDPAGLGVLVLEAMPGIPLARLLRLERRPGAWDEALLAGLGRWLGSFHAATAPPDRPRGALDCAVHGDLWARNVLVRPSRRAVPGALTGIVDWEASVAAGDPLRDVVVALVATADLDLAARGPEFDEIRRSTEGLARWLFLPGSPAFAGVAAFLRAWREAAAGLLEHVRVADLLLDRLKAGLRQGALGRTGELSPQTADELHAFLRGPGVFARAQQAGRRRVPLRR